MMNIPKKTPKKVERKPPPKAAPKKMRRPKKPKKVGRSREYRTGGYLTPRDRAYLESLKAFVRHLKGGWYSAREIAVAFETSHQLPWNRIARLRELGFDVEERWDETVLRPVKRFHIHAEADEGLLEKGLRS